MPDAEGGDTLEKLEAMTRVFEVFSDVLTGAPRRTSFEYVRTGSGSAGSPEKPALPQQQQQGDSPGQAPAPAKSMRTMEAAFQTLQTIVAERATLQVDVSPGQAAAMSEQLDARQRLKEQTRAQIAVELKNAALNPAFQKGIEKTSVRTGSDPLEDASRAVKSKIQGLLARLDEGQHGDAGRTLSDPTVGRLAPPPPTSPGVSRQAGSAVRSLSDTQGPHALATPTKAAAARSASSEAETMRNVALKMAAEREAFEEQKRQEQLKLAADRAAFEREKQQEEQRLSAERVALERAALEEEQRRAREKMAAERAAFEEEKREEGGRLAAERAAFESEKKEREAAAKARAEMLEKADANAAAAKVAAANAAEARARAEKETVAARASRIAAAREAAAAKSAPTKTPAASAPRTLRQGSGMQIIRRPSKPATARSGAGKKSIEVSASTAKQAKLEKLRGITALRSTSARLDRLEGRIGQKGEVVCQKHELQCPPLTAGVRGYFEQWGVPSPAASASSDVPGQEASQPQPKRETWCAKRELSPPPPSPAVRAHFEEWGVLATNGVAAGKQRLGRSEAVAASKVEASFGKHELVPPPPTGSVKAHFAEWGVPGVAGGSGHDARQEGSRLDVLEVQPRPMELVPPAPTGAAEAYFEEWGVVDSGGASGWPAAATLEQRVGRSEAGAIRKAEASYAKQELAPPPAAAGVRGYFEQWGVPSPAASASSDVPGQEASQPQ
eukprot:SAG22_NODE_488_length_9853_cov_2.555054_1_plen_729_part_10